MMNEIVSKVISGEATRDEERRRLAGLPGCRFVEVGEFVQLATSWRKLQRRNEPALDLFGLYDLETQEWFVIEEEKFDELWGETAAADPGP